MLFIGTSTAVSAAVFSTVYPQIAASFDAGANFSLLAAFCQIATVTLTNKTKRSMECVNKNQHPNKLDIYRRRMRFSLQQVAHLLGHKGPAALCGYERGARLPSLANALRLCIILRTPVEFLFYSLHDSLKTQIRAEEDRLAAQTTQQTLF